MSMKNDLMEVWQSAISKCLLFTFVSLNFVFQKRFSSIKSRLSLKVVFHQWSSSIKGRLLLPFWGPLAAILDFAGGAALQAVSERPLRR